MLRETTHADLISVMIAAVVTLSVQAALAFQKYRFNNGLMLGATLAAVDWYEDTTRRKGLPPSRRIVLLIATSAAAFTLAASSTRFRHRLAPRDHEFVTVLMLTVPTSWLKWSLST